MGSGEGGNSRRFMTDVSGVSWVERSAGYSGRHRQSRKWSVIVDNVERDESRESLWVMADTFGRGESGKGRRATSESIGGSWRKC